MIKMSDTKITRLRNLMSPVKNYFAMTKQPDIDGKLKDYIYTEHLMVQKVLPEILDIIKCIPDEACSPIKLQFNIYGDIVEGEFIKIEDDLIQIEVTKDDSGNTIGRLQDIHKSHKYQIIT